MGILRALWLPCLCFVAQSQTFDNTALLMGSHRTTLVGKITSVVLPQEAAQASMDAREPVAAEGCSFTVKLGPHDMRPIRYVQASAERRKADGTCEMDYDVGPPATPAMNGVRPADSGGGPGLHTDTGGVDLEWLDPLNIALTAVWVGQNFTTTTYPPCVTGANPWFGDYYFKASGWVFDSGGYTGGVSSPPNNPGCGCYSYSYATLWNFHNSTFCSVLIGISPADNVHYVSGCRRSRLP
jgi:hypothetical protein